MKMTFSIFLLLAAWQDLKCRKISLWLCILFGAAGVIENILWEETAWLQAAAAVLTGGALLLCSHYSRGGVGAGDGWFFVAAAVYLGFWNSIALLLYGLIFCSACCMGMIAWGVFAGMSVKKRRLPFLPFLIPAWIWSVFLGM